MKAYEEAMELLKGLLSEGEEVYIGECFSDWILFFGPSVQDIARKLDIAGCIEGTLHRMLENGCSDEQIQLVLSAKKTEQFDEESHDYIIDLGYVIPEFYLQSILHSGVEYQPPTLAYHVQVFEKTTQSDDGEWQVEKHSSLPSPLILPEDTTDDEVLSSLKQAGCLTQFGVDEDSLIVEGDSKLMDILSALDFRPYFRLELV